jgi:hypothetical protein
MSRIAPVVTVIALIVLVNVGLRFIDLPSVDVSLPSFDVPGWLEWVNRGKNVVLLTLLAVVVIGGISKEVRKRDR